jgi:hypothetical protein
VKGFPNAYKGLPDAAWGLNARRVIGGIDGGLLVMPEADTLMGTEAARAYEE